MTHKATFYYKKGINFMNTIAFNINFASLLIYQEF